MDVCQDDENGIVEDIDEFLPGSPLANREPVLRKGRLPPKKVVKQSAVPPELHIETQQRCGDDAGKDFLLSDDNEDGFIMSPRLRNRIEEARKKRLLEAMGGDHSPPPLTLPPPQARSNAPRADGPTGLKLSSGPKEEPKCVPPLPMVIPLQRAFSRDRSIPVVSRKKMGSCAPRWNGSYNTPVDLLGKRGGVTADEKRSVPASLSVQNGPGSLPHHEASRIPENSGDVAPGISFDDDASSPVSRRLRIPPKFNKNQDKSCNVTTDLIPSFTLPGSQLEDTVEAPTTQSQPVVTKGKTESVIPSKDMQRAEPRKSYNISRDEALERKQEGRFVHHISTIPSNKQGASDNVGVPSGKAGGVPRAEAGRNRFESFRPTALSLRPDDRDPLGALSPRLKNRVHERRVSRKLN